MTSRNNKEDLRLQAPQCTTLLPVEILHENPWFSLCNRGGYFTVEYHYPQVIILPIVNNHSVVMVRVTRPLMADITLELPAGGANEGESPVEAGRRELAEETGIEIDDINRFKPLHPISICPNRYPVLPHLYEIYLTDAEYSARKQHDDEIASVECLSLEEVAEKLCNGAIYVGLPMAILGRYLVQKSVSAIKV